MTMNVFGDEVVSIPTEGSGEIKTNFARHVLICADRRPKGCLGNGGFEVKKKLYQSKMEHNLNDVKISSIQSLEHCEDGPTMAVYPDGVWYGGLTPEDIPRITEEHLIGGTAVEELTFDPGLPDDFKHVVVCTFMANCGPEGGGEAFKYFMKKAREKDNVGVVQSHGCLKECSMGPVGCVYPDGDWYAGLEEHKYEDIWESHIERDEASKFRVGNLEGE